VYSTASDNYQCTINPMFDVGVIPGVGVQCPGEELTIYMDDEDSDNANRRSGWIGRTESTTNTRFRFCRVQGTQFRPRRSSSIQANYAVLRMGNACPNDSVPASVYWDNEDSSNKNSSNGHVAPSSVTTNTRLEICVFHASPDAEDVAFPTAWMPEQYGVFGTAELPGAIESGFIRADGDHSDNGNQMPTGVTAPFFYTKSFYIQVSMARVR
jgi:hypothetical protein